MSEDNPDLNFHVSLTLNRSGLENADGVYFSIPSEIFKLTDEIFVNLFFALIDSNNITISEITLSNAALRSCFTNANLHISSKGYCYQLFLRSSEECLERFQNPATFSILLRDSSFQLFDE